MENRKNKRNIYSRIVTFSVSDVRYRGTIDNISSSGVHVVIKEPIEIREGDEIFVTLANANLEQDVKKARIVWADNSGFGAKFEN